MFNYGFGQALNCLQGLIHQVLLICLNNFFPAESDIYVYNQTGKSLDDFDDQQASFGPSLPSGGIKGYLAMANPLHACRLIKPPPSINSTIKYPFWIALIQRVKQSSGNDSCTFDRKILNAQRFFNAVIIFNYEESLTPMNSDDSKGVLIPAVSITKSAGLVLIRHYVYNISSNDTPPYYIRITPDPPSRLTFYLLPFIAIIGICLLGLFGFVLVRCYLHRRRERRHRLPRSALKQLRVKKFRKGDPYEVCAICLDDFEEGAKIRILPCDHAYHTKCIDPWLLNNRRQCPVCKRYVFPNRDQDSDDDSDHHPTEQTHLLRATREPNNDSDRRDRRILHHPVNATTYSSFENDDAYNNTPNVNITHSWHQHSDTTDNSTLFQSANHNTTLEEHDGDYRQQQNRIQRTNNDQHGIYDSVRSSSFTDTRAANFFVGSVGDQNNSNFSYSHSYPDTTPITYDTRTTSNTNISVKSVNEMSSSTLSSEEQDDNNDNMHSVISDTSQMHHRFSDDYNVDNNGSQTIV
ncbi:unnamed protein product [Didymodactylos carnosus]|uniref:RING-type domain-containing protein n=1 Tax=Didymodactylos carnosus TaxID=1234261 RepID=A0A813UM12_9BILA|nr:unnamed protein product [Didymodactylos carnosus]CAF0825326.1 unnamed protein product [Didymodactylos carnosus]CAF3609810.1 unnamed protein product [Didymodactylos carnosus]CAF3611217.1 unnamed protein product [Didymodactylos carnosus]